MATMLRVWILVALVACTSACTNGKRGARGPSWKHHDTQHHHHWKQQQQPAKPTPPPPSSAEVDAGPADGGEIFAP
jgi:hypothetical protein